MKNFKLVQFRDGKYAARSGYFPITYEYLSIYNPGNRHTHYNLALVKDFCTSSDAEIIMNAVEKYIASFIKDYGELV